MSTNTDAGLDSKKLVTASCSILPQLNLVLIDTRLILGVWCEEVFVDIESLFATSTAMLHS